MIGLVFAFVAKPNLGLEYSAPLLILFALTVGLCSVFLYVGYVVLFHDLPFFIAMRKWYIVAIYFLFYACLAFTACYIIVLNGAIEKDFRVKQMVSKYYLEFILSEYSTDSKSSDELLEKQSTHADEMIEYIRVDIMRFNLTTPEREAVIDLISRKIVPTERVRPNDGNFVELSAFLTGVTGLTLLIFVLPYRIKHWRLRRGRPKDSKPVQVSLKSQFSKRDWAAYIIQRLSHLGVISVSTIVCFILISSYIITLERGKDAVAFSLSAPLAYSAVLAVCLFYSVWVLAAGRKRSVLFLRKFGDKNSNNLLANVVRDSLSDKVRLFVLDDGEFSAVTLQLKDRISAIGFVAPFIVILIAMIFGTFNVTIGPSYGSSSITEIVPDNTVVNPNAVRTRFLDRRSPLFDMPYGLFLWAATILLLLPIFVSVIGILRPSLTIVSRRDIHKLARRIAWSTSWFTAPRMLAPMTTLGKTDTRIWKHVVRELVVMCDLVVIDLTHNSESLKWELTTCLREAPNKCLVIETQTDADSPADRLVDEFNVTPVAYKSADDILDLSDHISLHPKLSPEKMFSST